MPMQTTPELSSAAPATSAPPAKRGWQLPRLQEAGLLVVILIIGAVLALLAEPVRGENGFLRPGNLIPSVFTVMSWIGVMAIGVTVVIITGGIDISVGSIMGLAALGCAAALLKLPENAPMWQVLPVGVGVPLLIGAICGLINGGLVVGLRMHPFIVTLGTMSIFRGIGNVAVTIKTLPAPGKILPASFTDDFMMYELPQKWVGVVGLQPAPILVALLCVIVGGIYLALTVWGRENYAVGGNEEAARFSGLPVGRIKLRVYALSGLAAGIAGLVSVGYFGSASTATGQGYELTVIAAAVVGGASLTGGRGTALGALLGALVIKLIENGIMILKLNREYSSIIIGIAIIVAVAIDRFSEYLRNRRLAGAKQL